jgi:hypothetical protein
MRQQQDGSPMRPNEAMNFLLLICQSLAATCEAFLHKGHGRRWPGIQGVIGLMVILFFPLLWPTEDPHPLIWLMGAYLGACFLARAGIVSRQFNGKVVVHSQYSGTPRIMRLLPFLSENTIKRLIEPLLVFTTGFVLLPLNKPLGSYLILAAIGLSVSTNAAEAWMRSRVQDLHDSVTEQREIAERFRRSNGNDW